jgi:glycosyltransferase involved in cell wall biosynthesis
MNVEPVSPQKPRVVIIRGDWLSRRDTQYYESLSDRYDLLGVSVRRTVHDLSLVTFPVVTPWSPDSLLAKLPPLQFAVDRALRLRSENLMYFWGLGRICRGASVIDVAETFHPFCLQAVRIRQKGGVRLVVRAHENIPFAHHNLAYRRYVKSQVFRWADAFITCSELGRHSLEMEGAPLDKIRVIPVGTDVQHFSPAGRDERLMADFGLTAEHFVVLFAGRIVWEKGVFDVLNAACLLRSGLPQLRVIVVGEGPELSKLRREVAARDLSDVVRVAGKAPVTSMPACYSVADVVVVPSIATPKWQEQFGGVVIEAMACGKALVASDSGAIPEVVGDAGIIVPQANYLSLAEAIFELYNDPALGVKLGKKARHRAVRNFSNEIVADQIRSLYHSLGVTGLAVPRPEEGLQNG